MKIVMVDLDVGNLESVREAFRRVGASVDVVSDPSEVPGADLVILPGVGSFADGMRALREKKLVEPLQHHVREERRPLFGICLGMQLLADIGEEHGPNPGLGLIPGKVRRLEPRSREYQVPNMGWCDVHVKKQGMLPAHSGDNIFYFAHSYYMDCAEESDIAAVIEYDERSIPVAVERGSVFGVQFHPEKSQDAGMDLLESVMKKLS